MLQRFVEEYSDSAFTFAYRLCENVEEAKELVQEAFFRLFKSWDHFDQSQPLEKWFLTILKNVYVDSVKKFDRRNMVPLDMPVRHEDGEGVSIAETIADERDEAVLDMLERRESEGHLKAALAGLTKEHRAILALCDMQGLGYDEISRVLGMPMGTVRSRVSRARTALREGLLKRTAGMVAYGV
ncbi:MAG: sigma-70 family RNA polymerase sigma factor [Elusimicrobia bacterium]|nr:sigma-70 family RNA polymerase sigma factor [Elusimicrobiota bacterium]